MQKIKIIGVPMDLGASCRGANLGPTAIRQAGVIERLEKLGYEVDDFGDIPVNKVASQSNEHGMNYFNEVKEANTALASQVSDSISQGYFPLLLGGDHSMSIGSIAGIAEHKKNLGVIWYDAHGDLNTDKSSPSGNIHGMPLAVGLGLGHPELINIHGATPKIKPEHVVLIGIRELDAAEKKHIRDLGIRTYTMHEVEEQGIATVMKEAIEIVSNGTDGVHLSLDIDGLDPFYAPGVGTAVPGGLTYRESKYAMELLAESGILTSFELVEVNPLLDENNRTAQLATDLISAVFGEKVL